MPSAWSSSYSPATSVGPPRSATTRPNSRSSPIAAFAPNRCTNWSRPKGPTMPNASPLASASPVANSAAAPAAARNRASRPPPAKRLICWSRSFVADAHEHRAGFVVLGGRSNVGKSTLLNRIVGQKVAIVTPRPQTTRRRILGVRNEPDAQILIVDTPGLHEATRLLNRRMVEVARAAMAQGDVLAVVVEAGERLAAEDRAVLAEAD